MTDTTDNRVRVDWIEPDDFEADGFYGYEEPEQTQATNELIEKLNSGEWRVEDAVAYVTCPCCGKESIGASLHWIVTAYDTDGDAYRSEIEAELTREALVAEKLGALQ